MEKTLSQGSILENINQHHKELAFIIRIYATLKTSLIVFLTERTSTGDSNMPVKKLHSTKEC